ncbi:protein LSD1-like isoform X1 [Hibiscus syriacus]|uniref:protein LSD1-like isoform X1 n=1 Tax=Hibiscus syriacus TaxID=106335 RepID=UPI001924DAD1|nr:protein LSD1-like isoform X1 [Hibiscus syriacus]
MQSQLVCSGCRSILLYPRRATSVRCALCNTITPTGMEMAQLICGGCRTLLMYTRGATSVRCSCCHTINIAPASNQIAHINCGHCHTTLMYPHGAPSVKCAVCQYVTNVGIENCIGRFTRSLLSIPHFQMGNVRVPPPVNRPNETAASGSKPSTSPSLTVVVENPMSVDESGKLVSNVVVGITTGKR